jgi:hypothetical protein
VFQRPAAWAGKTSLTDTEVAQLKKASQKLEEAGDALFGDELIIDALDGKQQSEPSSDNLLGGLTTGCRLRLEAA